MATHFWRDGVCEVCGSRFLGAAQIATLINKVHHKRLDGGLEDWKGQLARLGPIAIPQIVRELLEMYHEYGELPNAPSKDLCQALVKIGPAGAKILKEVVGNTPEVPANRSMYKPGQKAWLEELAAEISGAWETGG